MQVSGLSDPLVSARIQHALSETNSGFGPAPCAIGVRSADALQAADEGGQEVGGHPRRSAVRRRTPQAHSRYIRAMTCTYTCSQETARAGGGARAGRTWAGRRECNHNPGAGRCRADAAPQKMAVPRSGGVT
jgi:hypothetical protein